jgi:hypothetical protein
MVSGVTIVATSASACLPRRLPISARVLRSPSVRRTRPWSYARRIRFSAARYSLRHRSSSSTDPVIYVRSCFHPMDLVPSTTASRFTSEYETLREGNQDWERAIGGSQSPLKQYVWVFLTKRVSKHGQHLLDVWAEVSRPDRGRRGTTSRAVIATRPQPPYTRAYVPSRTDAVKGGHHECPTG